MDRLERAFCNCEKLQQHMRFLLAKGSLYKLYNGNLLYHGCIPLNEDGTFRNVTLWGRTYCGKELYEVLDSYVRKGFVAVDEAERERGRVTMWYIWLHENSPLFGKDKMATFERYFLSDPETHRERKNPYYRLLEDEQVADRILAEFGLQMCIRDRSIASDTAVGIPVKAITQLMMLDTPMRKIMIPVISALSKKMRGSSENLMDL